MTKLAVQIDRMCVVELATALDLVSGIIPLPYGFRAVGSRVIWDTASAGRGQLIRIQRTTPAGSMRTRYVAADAQFEIVGDFDQIVFVEPPA